MSINRRFPPQVRVSRTKMWLGIYILDRLISVPHGRPFIIHDEDCDEWNIADLDPEPLSKNHEDASQKAKWLLSSMQASRLHGDVQRMLFHHDAMSDPTPMANIAVALSERLALIENGIPDRFRLEKITYPSDSFRISAALQLYIICSNAHLLLTRHFFLLCLLRDTTAIGNEVALNFFFRESVALCIPSIVQ